MGNPNAATPSLTLPHKGEGKESTTRALIDSNGVAEDGAPLTLS